VWCPKLTGPDSPGRGAALRSLALDLSSTATFWPKMTDSEKRGTADGVAIGAIAVAFIEAYPAQTEGEGGNSLTWLGSEQARFSVV
jgi:hypothetical protein